MLPVGPLPRRLPSSSFLQANSLLWARTPRPAFTFHTWAFVLAVFDSILLACHSLPDPPFRLLDSPGREMLPLSTLPVPLSIRSCLVFVCFFCISVSLALKPYLSCPLHVCAWFGYPLQGMQMLERWRGTGSKRKNVLFLMSETPGLCFVTGTQLFLKQGPAIFKDRSQPQCGAWCGGSCLGVILCACAYYAGL